MNHSLLKSFRCGIERESHLIDGKGELSKLTRPSALGSPLTHPWISSDFGKQQLEWITPPRRTLTGAKSFLEELMRYTLSHVPDAFFWPFSMPCPLKNTEIATFGTSHQGQQKTVYRKGLMARYGAPLQMISGVHLNFSFPLIFWESFYKKEHSPLSFQAFINEKSMGLIRNFLREGWIMTYLFGASPAFHPSYHPLPSGFKSFKDCFIAPYATSLRTSHLGYYSRVQNQLAISFNSVEEYLEEMKQALTTPREEYRAIKEQLNPFELQIENEHYTRIRPKGLIKGKETSLEAIEKRGIGYLEIRAMDCDPFSSVGITRESMDFLHLFLLYALFKESPPLSKEDRISLTHNQDRVALEGRKPDLLLKRENDISLKMWSKEIFDKLRPLSKKLGKKRLLEEQWMKLEDPNLTPSAKLLRCIENKGYVAAALFLAKRHKKALLEAPLSPSRQKQLEEVSADSLIENRRLESASKILTPEYEDLELSTQIVIKKALERGVSVEVLDREDQLLRLSREGHVEYIKEATKTSKDTYITPYLLENKEVTKRLLFEKGLFVPLGKVYTSEKMAVENYSRFENIKIVVKPKATNMGVGITFVKPHEPSSFAAAVYAAFRHGSSVVVEPFCEGEEYRFLIIDQELIAVAQRLPAHVIGDGKRTIRELVKAKNHDPDYYREPKCHLILSEVEKNCLKKQRLSPASIPKKGKQVFLRENSNVSTGGDAIDVTDDLHSGYGRIAIEAAQTFEAKICGVDMMIVSAHEAPTPKNYAIVELNYNPVLFIHAHPFKGKARDVAGPLLDLLGFTIP